MSDGMRDALIFSGLLLTIVLLTQFGRHKFGPIKLLLPLGLVGYVGWDMLNSMHFTKPNLSSAGVGIAIGVLVGFGLLATMRVERDPNNGKAYTKAGFPYLLLWLVVLIGRIAFFWAIENVHSFGEKFGEFIVKNNIDNDGVAAFFVLMAMAMILIRTIGVTMRTVRLPQAGRTRDRVATG